MLNKETEKKDQDWMKYIRDQQNFYGGLVIIGTSLFTVWATWDLDGMTGYRFGPGTAPRLVACLFGISGVILLLQSFIVTGPNIGRFSIRGSFFVVASVLFFATSVGVCGIVISGFLTIIIASAGSQEFRPIESIIWAAFLTAFCALLFVWLLNLPLPLWPKF